MMRARTRRKRSTLPHISLARSAAKPEFSAINFPPLERNTPRATIRKLNTSSCTRLPSPRRTLHYPSQTSLVISRVFRQDPPSPHPARTFYAIRRVSCQKPTLPNVLRRSPSFPPGSSVPPTSPEHSTPFDEFPARSSQPRPHVFYTLGQSLYPPTPWKIDDGQTNPDSSEPVLTTYESSSRSITFHSFPPPPPRPRDVK